EPNWPITAYISGMVLAAGWLSRQVAEGSYRRATKIGVSAVCGLGLLITLLLHHSEWAHPLLVQFAGSAAREPTVPLVRLDPTCRLRGWHTLGAAVDEVCAELRREGVEPVVVGTGWSLPGEVGFYCAGHPAVYSVGPFLGDRRSQYDLWRPNLVDDDGTFRGKTFVIVGGGPAIFRGVFDSFDPPRSVTHYEEGLPVAAWTLVVGRGFRGFPRVQGRAED